MVNPSDDPRISGRLLLLIILKVTILIVAWIGVTKFFPPDSVTRHVLQLLIAFTLVAILAWLTLKVVLVKSS